MWQYCLLVLICPWTGAFSTEEEIMVLTTGDFPAVLEEIPVLMIEFYSPDCINCQRFAPVYSEVAASLKSKSARVKLAQVNCDVETEIKEKFQIRTLPTILYFKEGKVTAYQGYFKAEALEHWLLQRQSTTYTVVDEHQIASHATQSTKVVFRIPAHADTAALHVDLLESLSLADDHNGTLRHSAYFLVHTEEELSVEILRPDSQPVKTTQLEESRLQSWISLHEEAPLVGMTQRTIMKIFQKMVDGMVLFNPDNDSLLHRSFQEVAEHWRKTQSVNLIFVELTSANEHYQGLSQFLQIDPVQIPVVFLNSHKKLKVPLVLRTGQTLTPALIRQFIENRNQIQGYKLTEIINPKKHNSQPTRGTSDAQDEAQLNGDEGKPDSHDEGKPNGDDEVKHKGNYKGRHDDEDDMGANETNPNNGQDQNTSQGEGNQGTNKDPTKDEL